jgi:hypothetical protein
MLYIPLCFKLVADVITLDETEYVVVFGAAVFGPY